MNLRYTLNELIPEGLQAYLLLQQSLTYPDLKHLPSSLILLPFGQAAVSLELSFLIGKIKGF